MVENQYQNDSVDLDGTAVPSGSALFVKASVLVCRDERLNRTGFERTTDNIWLCRKTSIRTYQTLSMVVPNARHSYVPETEKKNK